MTNGTPELNRIFHQPVRTRIAAFLANAGEADFTTIKKSLGLSDGHMSTHMKELVENGYVGMEKSFKNNKPLTVYRMTERGRMEFGAYLAALRKIIEAGE